MRKSPQNPIDFLNKFTYIIAHYYMELDMHSETMILGYILAGLRLPIPYRTMCLYNGIRWACYVSAQNHNSYADPGYIFEIPLN